MTRQQIDDKAQLVSVLRAKEEIEKLLCAQKVRSKVEQETRDDIHCKTLKVSGNVQSSVEVIH